MIADIPTTTSPESVIRRTPAGEFAELLCPSGRHADHDFVPWFYGALYDRLCVVHGCPEPAAFSAGSGFHFVLCDCHAQDWSEFNDRFPEYVLSRPEGVPLRDAGAVAIARFLTQAG